MKDWFEQFSSSLTGGELSEDLIGAGSADAQRAMRHYRFQHQSKIREAIEETFIKLKTHLDNEWDKYWDEFWNTSPQSPRSLDFVSGVFLDFFLASKAPQHLKELGKFEYALEVHSWTHENLHVISPLEGLDEETCLELAPLNIHHYKSPVVGLYHENSGVDLISPQTVLIWATEQGVHFRSMEEWEIKVLQLLPQGIGAALEQAPDNPDKVSCFFQWLGESGLIKSFQKTLI